MVEQSDDRFVIVIGGAVVLFFIAFQFCQHGDEGGDGGVLCRIPHCDVDFVHLSRNRVNHRGQQGFVAEHDGRVRIAVPFGRAHLLQQGRNQFRLSDDRGRGNVFE